MSRNSSKQPLDVEEVEMIPTPKLDRRNNGGWVTPSGRYSVNTLNTMDTKVANDLSGFSQTDENSQKTWARRFVEKVLMKVSSDIGCSSVFVVLQTVSFCA